MILPGFIPDALSDVIIGQTRAMLNYIIENNPGKIVTIDELRNKLRIFDFADKYTEVYEEADEDHEDPSKLEEFTSGDYKFENYYQTLREIIRNLTPDLIDAYKIVSGRNLPSDINAILSGKLSSKWSRIMSELFQPRLFKHKDDKVTPSERLPMNYDQDNSVYDENGWAYAGWYQSAVRYRSMFTKKFPSSS